MGAIDQLVTTPTERVAATARARHGKIGPKLDCGGLSPAASDDGDLVYCSDCGMVLVRGLSPD